MMKQFRNHIPPKKESKKLKKPNSQRFNAVIWNVYKKLSSIRHWNRHIHHYYAYPCINPKHSINKTAQVFYKSEEFFNRWLPIAAHKFRFFRESKDYKRYCKLLEKSEPKVQVIDSKNILRKNKCTDQGLPYIPIFQSKSNSTNNFFPKLCSTEKALFDSYFLP